VLALLDVVVVMGVLVFMRAPIKAKHSLPIKYTVFKDTKPDNIHERYFSDVANNCQRYSYIDCCTGSVDHIW
jgi:hypothetical protein